MTKELRADAISAWFLDQLASMDFIPSNCHDTVKLHLETLVTGSQNRHVSTEAAKSLWKLFFKSALQDITENMRGYEEICEYLDQYVDYERLLFALDDNYRDHGIHAVWVMLLGLYLDNKFKLFANIRYADCISGLPEEAQKLVELTKKHDKALWCMIALCHDLGYPVEKTVKANRIMNSMISKFGFITKSEFGYDFGVVHHTAIEHLLKAVSSDVHLVRTDAYYITNRIGAQLDFAKTLERLDHGIMSAYLVQTYLDYICEIEFSTEGKPQGMALRGLGGARDTLMAGSLLRAVAGHTNRNIYGWQIATWGDLLTICDELDEFSRYSRLPNSDNWQRIGCRTEFDYADSSMTMSYTFDNKDMSDNIEGFFKAKVRKILNRFEVRHDALKAVRIMCSDVRKPTTVEFSFEKTLETPNGIAKDAGGRTHPASAYLRGE